MKRKSLLLIGTIIILIIFICSYTQYTNNSRQVFENSHTTKSNNSNTLSIMYETSSGSGEYVVSNSSTWPSEGYTFNERLSKCENGSELTWDDTTKAVIFSGNVSDKCYVYFDKITLAQTCAGENLASCFAENYSLDSTLLYHDSSLANGANDGSYRYAGGDYELTSKATAAGYTTLIDSSASETTGLIKFYCNGSVSFVGNSCSTSYPYYYTVAGGTAEYSTYQAALDAAVSQGYLTSNNVKNFVCFGSDAATCPEDNLYRIIGVFDGKVKLIKYDYATSDLLGTDGDYSGTVPYHYSGMRDLTKTHYWYYWNKVNYSTAYNETNYYNVWSYSELNKTNLNKNFINNIGTKWANMISETTWKVGGNTYTNIYSKSVATAYQNEIVNPDSTVETTYNAKIGLMYASDYGYATSPSNWTIILNSYNNASAKSTNWMYMGDYEWTISRRSDNTLSAFRVHIYGHVFSDYVGNVVDGVRPSFYLESSVTIAGGSGEAGDPFRIS